MATHLQEGDKAPAFTGLDQDGNKISLAALKGTKVVLYFYPQDMTPTCTIQSCNLRDNYALLQKNGYVVIGVSPDDAASHIKFATRNSLPFPLIADTKHTLIEKYGVWGPKQLYGRKYMGLYRTTFVINEKGIISKIYLRPKNKAHAEEILADAQA